MADQHLNTLSLGEGQPQVAYLHGLFGQGRNWQGIASKVAEETNSSALLIDLPDHGRSPWTPDGQPISLDGYAQAVQATMAKHAGGAPWVLVGHSLGGKVAMTIALHHPELIEHLVIVDMAAKDYGNLSRFASYIQAMREMPLEQISTREQADEWLAERESNAGVRAFLLQNLRRASSAEQEGGGPGWRWQNNLGAIAADEARGEEAAIAGFDAGGRTFEGPVTAVRGEASDYVSDEDVEAMREIFPSMKVVTVKGASHWVHTEEPEIMIEILTRIVDSVR